MNLLREEEDVSDNEDDGYEKKIMSFPMTPKRAKKTNMDEWKP